MEDNITDLYGKLNSIRNNVEFILKKENDLDLKMRSAILAILEYLNADFDLNDNQELYVKTRSSKTSSGKERGFTNNKVKEKVIKLDKKNIGVRSKADNKRK